MTMLGHIRSLRRYPVKSMLGQSMPALAIDRRGAAGDRLFALRDTDGKLGSGKTTRRFRRIDGMFGFTARLEGAVPVIRFPDSRVLRGDDPGIDAALSAAVGIAVTLAREDRVPHVDQSPLHLLTTASLAWLKARLPESAVDVRRFRPNLLIETAGDALVEQSWVGRVLAIGADLRIKVTHPAERCVMVTNPQEELRQDVAILRTLAQLNEECFGVYAEVVAPGTIRCGDPVSLSD